MALYNTTEGYREVQLVTIDDPEYVAFMRRMADSRPGRGGPRQAGEVLGGLIERCVRHWLSSYVPLMEERILTWEQRMRNGRTGRMFRELDGVWAIDDVSLCLFEMKMTFPENMERGVGLKQLNVAAETLFASRRYEYILKRLVYVATEQVAVLEDLPVLEPNDENAELGVVWVPPDSVEAAAKELEIELPENWREPESREGHFEDPEREAWREFADTEARNAPVAADGEIPADNPLAAALRRLQQNE